MTIRWIVLDMLSWVVMTVGDEFLQKACDDLLTSLQTLQLATRAANGDAEISYAPFVQDQCGFYIFISELAKHTHNLRNHPQVSVLLIEPEVNAKNPFARQRLTINCLAHEVSAVDSLYEQQLKAMQQRFGAIVELLRGLPDFSLWVLVPQQGTYVAGFGHARLVDAQLRLQTASESGS